MFGPMGGEEKGTDMDSSGTTTAWGPHRVWTVAFSLLAPVPQCEGGRRMLTSGGKLSRKMHLLGSVNCKVLRGKALCWVP